MHFPVEVHFLSEIVFGVFVSAGAAVWAVEGSADGV